MIFSNVWGLCLCMLVCISCISDELSVNGSGDDYVSLNLQTGTTPVVLTRNTEPGETQKNEDKIEHVDVYIFNSLDGKELKHYQRVTVGTDMKVTLSLRKEDVKNGTYDVYVVANCNLAENVMEAAKTVDTLMDLCTTTEFKFPTGQAVYEPSFLMDGKALKVSSLGNDTSSLIIDLKRAAAKIRVKVRYGEITNDDGSVSKFESFGVPQKKMINYATRTTLWEDSKLVDQPDFERKLDRMSDYISITENEAVFYSYANKWEYNPESSEVDLQNETYILLNLPMRVTTIDSNGDESSVTLSPNYYSISLNGTGGEQKLERNHFYDIAVTVAAEGSATETRPVELKGKLQVQLWQSQTINVGNDNAHFLEVSDDTIRITNSDTDNSVIFYSSESVTNVKIKEGSVKFIDKFGVEKSIPQTGYDAYPDASYMPSVTIDEGNTGIIHINSKELINVPKTFTIVVTSGGIEREIYVEQYPLEYITSTQGWYSYRDNVASTYEKFVNGDYSIDTNIFEAKVVKSYDTSTGTSGLYYYSWDRYGNLAENDKVSGNTNARMYHVHITTTPQVGDVSYRLGYPKLDSNGVTDSGNDNKTLVSPSFMIASQLGSVTSNSVGNLSEAANHCKNYAEVTGTVWKNGYADYSNVEYYDDWRLPTEAELKIIALYQGEKNSAIDKVLAGTYYWAAHGTVRVDGGSSGTGLRCVRDVK